MTETARRANPEDAEELTRLRVVMFKGMGNDAARAWASVSTRAMPTDVQPELSSISSRSSAAWYSIDTGPTATSSDCTFFMISM